MSGERDEEEHGQVDGEERKAWRPETENGGTNRKPRFRDDR